MKQIQYVQDWSWNAELAAIQRKISCAQRHFYFWMFTPLALYRTLYYIHVSHYRWVTSFSCSLRSLYSLFWDSRKLFNSFFCWAWICCWNFFSSLAITLAYSKSSSKSVWVPMDYSSCSISAPRLGTHGTVTTILTMILNKRESQELALTLFSFQPPSTHLFQCLISSALLFS